MTSRNRSPRRTSAPRRRTGRNVWVNTSLAAGLVANSTVAIGLLGGAADFMTFDTTIVGVIIPDLTLMGVNSGSVSQFRTRWALQIAPTTMDSDDFQVPDADSIGPPWMHVKGKALNILASAPFTLDYVEGQSEIRVKAKRRFRENDSTLFMVFQSVASGGVPTSLSLVGMVRTLLHIP